MNRARSAALALGALLAGPAYAVDVPRPPAPPDQVDVAEPHRYRPVVIGAVAAAAGTVATAGIALVSDSYRRYGTYLEGGGGESCRPCSTAGIAGLRGEYGLGFALIGTGVVLAITSVILRKLDWNYQRDNLHMRMTKLELTPAGIRF